MKKRRRVDRIPLPDRILATVPESRILTSLQALERRIDATIAATNIAAANALTTAPLIVAMETLRIHVSHEHSAADGLSAWNLRVTGITDSGRPLGSVCRSLTATTTTTKMTTTTTAAAVTDVFEWNKATSPAVTDGFEISRSSAGGDGGGVVRLMFRWDNHPTVFRISPVLADVIQADVDTHINAVKAVWKYIAINGLTHPTDPALFRPDKRLREAMSVVPPVQMPVPPKPTPPLGSAQNTAPPPPPPPPAPALDNDSVPLTALNDALRHHLLPLAPIVIEYDVESKPATHDDVTTFECKVPAATSQLPAQSFVTSASLPPVLSVPVLPSIAAETGRNTERIADLIAELNAVTKRREFLQSFASNPVETIAVAINQQISAQIAIDNARRPKSSGADILSSTPMGLDAFADTKDFAAEWIDDAIDRYLHSKDRRDGGGGGGSAVDDAMAVIP